MLKGDGITSALVAAAGDIACSRPPTGRESWRIEIAAPVASTTSADKRTRYLSLRDAAVSTSGDTEQDLDVSSRHYSHIINPATGMALPDATALPLSRPGESRPTATPSPSVCWDRSRSAVWN